MASPLDVSGDGGGAGVGGISARTRRGSVVLLTPSGEGAALAAPTAKPMFERPIVGLIGGSGLLKTKSSMFTGLRFLVVHTTHGRVVLRHGPLDGGGTLVFVQRHEADPTRVYTQPADINFAAIALALKLVGCTRVVGICSVGSLKTSYEVGALVVPDDYYNPSDIRRVYADSRGHFLPAFDGRVRIDLLEALHEQRLRPHSTGTYVNSAGPRFETKAEIRVFSAAGDVLGMTGAHEASACQEVGLAYAMVCIVDNYCNGISGDKLTLERFHDQQKKNLALVERMLDHVINRQAAELRIEFAEAEALRSGLLDESSPAGTHAGDDSAAAAGGGGGGSGGARTGVRRRSHGHGHGHGRSHESGSADAAAPPSSSPAPPVEVDLTIHARYIIPVIPENVVLQQHCVVVDKGRIIDILPSEEAEPKYLATRSVRIPEHALIPGMVNCHTHLPMNHLRGLADDLPLMEWLTTKIWPTEGRMMSREFCRTGARLAMAECIRSGVTCVNDMYWFPEGIVEEVYHAGVRGCHGMTLMEFPSGYAKDPADYLAKGEACLNEWKTRDTTGRIRFTVAPHAPYTVADETMVVCKAIAERLDTKIHIHLHETEDEVRCSELGIDGPARHLSAERMRPLANLDRLGLVNERLIAVHMTQLTDAEIARLAEAKASVVHCPTSNLKLASGFCPIAKLASAGVNTALGTDSAASNNCLDLFAEMKLAAVLAKGVAKDATAIPAAQALRMATLNGAIALGLDREIGSIEVGKSADLVAVRLDHLEQLPVYNVISHLVYACSRERVTDVWVQGAPIMINRKLVTLDEGEVKMIARMWMAKVHPGPNDPLVAGTGREGEDEEGASSVPEGPFGDDTGIHGTTGDADDDADNEDAEPGMVEEADAIS